MWMVRVSLMAAALSLATGAQAQSTAVASWKISEADIARWRLETPRRDTLPAPGRVATKRVAKQQVSYSTPGKRKATAFALGLLGMVVGGRVGAAIEGDSCRCDDPGFKGFFIGAPIGATLGAILGLALVD